MYTPQTKVYQDEGKTSISRRLNGHLTIFGNIKQQQMFTICKLFYSIFVTTLYNSIRSSAVHGMWLRYDCNDLVARVWCVCVLERSVTDYEVVVWLVV